MALKWFQQPSQKACVVGLDGVPYSMLTKFMADGVMPNLARIGQGGRVTEMTVSLPEISSVSWSTFMTGKNPGEHGIYGFTDLHAGTYKMSFPSFRELKCDTIWDRLGEQKMRSVVINQPATYPARPIHGALVSGFVAIHLDKSVFPAKYLPTAKQMGYEVDLNAQEVKDNPTALFVKLDELLEARRKLMDALWDDEKWNLMEVIVTGTDRLHHFMWDAYEDSNHAHHEDFLNYYRNVDKFIGHVHEKFSKTENPENFFVLSDHGFCQTRHEVYGNRVLAENGYLKLTSPDSNDLGDISEHATAFVLDPARVYVHRRGGRFPRGSVGENDVSRIKSELKDLFAGIKDAQGNPIVRYIFDGDEVYSGPQKHLAPDLLLVPHNGFDFKGRVNAPSVVGDRRLQGMHTWDDAFFLTTRTDLLPESETKDFKLVDIPGKILQSLDVES